MLPLEQLLKAQLYKFKVMQNQSITCFNNSQKIYEISEIKMGLMLQI